MVKFLSLRIGTDWRWSRGNREPLFNLLQDMCTEEKWWHIFAKHVQPHHNLNKLMIYFNGWRNIKVDDKYWSASHDMTFLKDRKELVHWREKLLNFFDDYMRGISKVKFGFTNGNGSLTRQQIYGLEMKMSRPKSTALPRALPKKKTLSAALRQMTLARSSKETDGSGEDSLGG